MHGFSVPVKPRLRSTAVQHGRISAATLTRTVHNVGPPVAQRDDALRGVGVVPAYIPPLPRHRASAGWAAWPSSSTHTPNSS